MCGIAGLLLHNSKARVDDVRMMTDLIRHRGPDDEGIYLDGPCGIGMRRLSIIDLNTGHQPISNEDGSVWVVFNGEIYNYQELRDDLISRGHRFTTNSDTETLVHLYEQEGTEGLHRLRGMFAYCIWDARKRKMLLVRDRFGKKPLYYAKTPTGFYFASELKCLRAAGVPLDLDSDALRLYFRFGNIPEPYSAFRAIRKLMPGCWIECSADGATQQGRYWRLPAFAEENQTGLSEAQARERVRELFDEAVRIRLISDVPLGAFLSGGIDSSLVVASMALQSPEPVKTFSVGFEESGYNELPYARLVAKKYKTDHHDIIVRPDSVSLIDKLVHHFDEPFSDSSAIPAYLVSEFAARHVKVALSGDGGDEFFAGYRIVGDVQRYSFLDRVPQTLRKLVSWTADVLPYSAYGKSFLRMVGSQSPLERYFNLNFMPYFLRKKMLTPEWMLSSDVETLGNLLPDNFLDGGADIVSQAMYFEATTILTGDFLVSVDRPSMAASLEVRCPFLDHRLAEFATRIPASWKWQNGKGKRILLDALGDRLPTQLLTRKKMGFSVPLAQWFRGPLRELVHDSLLSPTFLDRGIVSAEFVRYMLAEHDRGRRSNHAQIYRLIMLELWFKSLDQPVSATVDSVLC
ncbi:MAG TPA: asparagine synthase (glutamine-hydrolyzing) [Candidatus Eisenbacteria bacterium]|nr:asparagine synthase (glutamine-hydrolyzing) [Candidatus Eisenbacteria bacterium]